MKYIIEGERIKAIADAIRIKTKKDNLINIRNMPQEILSIFSGEDSSLQEKEVSPTKTIQVITADIGYSGLIKVIVNAIRLQNKTVKPLESEQIIYPDSEYDGLEEVIVEGIKLQSKVVNPTADTQVIESDTEYDALKSVKVNPIKLQEKTIHPTTVPQEVQADEGNSGLSKVTVEAIKLQNKTVTPSESAQTVSCDTNYDAIGEVEVKAISNTYVGSGVGRKSSSDLTANGSTVNVPSGYYENGASKSVSNGSVTVNTPTVNSSGLVTASANVNAGYISGNPSSKTLQLNTQASKAITPTKSQQVAVSSGVYTTGQIVVEPIPSQYIDSSEVKAVWTYDSIDDVPPASTFSNGDIILVRG